MWGCGTWSPVLEKNTRHWLSQPGLQNSWDSGRHNTAHGARESCCPVPALCSGSGFTFRTFSCSGVDPRILVWYQLKRWGECFWGSSGSGKQEKDKNCTSKIKIVGCLRLVISMRATCICLAGGWALPALLVPKAGIWKKAKATSASPPCQSGHTWHMSWEKMNLGNILARTGQDKNSGCESCLGAACWSFGFGIKNSPSKFKNWECFSPGCFRASMENNFLLTVLICLELCAKS